MKSLKSIVGDNGEDFIAKIPLIGPLTGAKTNEYKALLKKQEEMAKAAEARAAQQHQQGLQGLSQGMMAFGPRNQMMAQMFGPEAAFSPDQMAAMVSDPAAKPLAEAEQAWIQSAMQNPIDPKTRTRTQGAMNPQIQKDLELARANERRKQALLATLGPMPSGPAPIQMPRPQPGRR